MRKTALGMFGLLTLFLVGFVVATGGSALGWNSTTTSTTTPSTTTVTVTASPGTTTLGENPCPPGYHQSGKDGQPGNDTTCVPNPAPTPSTTPPETTTVTSTTPPETTTVTVTTPPPAPVVVVKTTTKIVYRYKTRIRYRHGKCTCPAGTLFRKIHGHYHCVVPGNG